MVATVALDDWARTPDRDPRHRMHIPIAHLAPRMSTRFLLPILLIVFASIRNAERKHLLWPLGVEHTNLLFRACRCLARLFDPGLPRLLFKTVLLCPCCPDAPRDVLFTNNHLGTRINCNCDCTTRSLVIDETLHRTLDNTHTRVLVVVQPPPKLRLANHPNRNGRNSRPLKMHTLKRNQLTG